MPVRGYVVCAESRHGARVRRGAEVVGAGAAGVDVGDEGMGGGCQGLEDAFGHCGTAYELLVERLGEGMGESMGRRGW